MNKKKIIGLAGAVVVCILVFVFIVIRGKSPNPAENPEEMLGRIENAVGDEYKKQSCGNNGTKHRGNQTNR